jgi:hypothetical protein
MPTLTPVSHDQHGARHWRRFSSYAFVQAHPVVPIVLGEHEQVAACLPILFSPSAAGPWPVALTRLGAQTALVAGNGAWRGSYVPSILRVHPFHARPTEGGQFALLVDETSGLITDNPDDPPFFTPEGTLAPELTQVVDFFQKRVRAEGQTRAAMAAISRAGLLTPFTPPEGMALPADGLLAVDRAALGALGRVALADLHRADALGLLYAAVVGRHHLGLLAHAEDQFARMAQTPAATPSSAKPADAELSGFFDALASAQDEAPQLTDWVSAQAPKPTDTSH